MPNLRKLSQSGDRTSMLFSTWETFSRKRFEQGFLQGYAESHGGLEALAEYYAEREGRGAQAKCIAELEKDSEEVRIQHRMLDLIEGLAKDNKEDRKEREALAKRIAELEKITKERDR
jgi:hypothetical protein